LLGGFKLLYPKWNWAVDHRVANYILVYNKFSKDRWSFDIFGLLVYLFFPLPTFVCDSLFHPLLKWRGQRYINILTAKMVMPQNMEEIDWFRLLHLCSSLP
jgi:hypothetical protein